MSLIQGLGEMTISVYVLQFSGKLFKFGTFLLLPCYFGQTDRGTDTQKEATQNAHRCFKMRAYKKQVNG